MLRKILYIILVSPTNTTQIQYTSYKNKKKYAWPVYFYIEGFKEGTVGWITELSRPGFSIKT